MYTQEYNGINSCLVGLSKLLLSEGVMRHSRGQTTYELREPIIIKIKNPLSRLITIEPRRWNHVLPYAESLWLATGRNDMEFIGTYLKRMYEFSDDQLYMRAGYGPRLRYFSGTRDDYKLGFVKTVRQQNPVFAEVDQFQFIEKIFAKDPFTRQAIISFTDPVKDYFINNDELKATKDFPCTTGLQFIRRDNSLDLVVNMRSNDLMWGASGVNIFNFTFIQEYFAQILGLTVGCYYHIVNNLHFYEPFLGKIQLIANSSSISDEHFTYKKNFNTLADFDKLLGRMESYENALREKKTTSIMEFEDEFFNDWAKVLFQFHTRKTVTFQNPILNQLTFSKNIYSPI